MEEKGRPWLSKLGVATETTGVVSEWVDWETPRRWALFCRKSCRSGDGRWGSCPGLALHSKARLASLNPGPGGVLEHGGPAVQTRRH